MDEIEETDNYSILTDYDDGVVCFGAVTQSQIERYKRLPRHTILPSDIQSIRESMVNSEKDDEDDENDQSSSILDNYGKNTTISIDDSINDLTETTNFLDNKESTSIIQLKQSYTNDSSSVFSSPCASKFMPSEKLIDTETINRYIRMESLSPNETFSEDQDKSAFVKDETVSYIDVDEDTELPTNNFVHNETSSCKSSISSVIEQSIINNHKIPDRDDNVCTLKHCSQQEDDDLSYCCDSEFEDVEYSIVPDKYSITPGKQRLFDSRHVKPSIRTKTVVSSVPFMDKIEETTTPLPKALNSSPILSQDTSYEPLENVEHLDRTSVTSLGHKSSVVHFNQTSDNWDLKSKNSFDETVEELSKSTNFNYSVSESDTVNCVNYRKSAIMDMESLLHDSVVEQTYENNLQNTSTSLNNKTISDFYAPLKVVNETLIDTSYVTEKIYDTDKSKNNISNVEVPILSINDCNNEKSSEAVLTEIKSPNFNVVDVKFDKTMSATILSTIDNDKDLNKISNNSRTVNDTLNVTKQSFDDEKSMISMSNIIIPMVDANNFYKMEESEAMEGNIKSNNTSIVDNIVDETMDTSILSTIDNNKDLNKTSNESRPVNDTLNMTKQSFDGEKSMTSMSNIIIPMVDANNFYNVEESEALEGNIKSNNTSIVDNIVDETMGTSILSTIDNNKDLNKTSNESRPVNDTLNVTKQSFDVEKSMTSMSNIIISMVDANNSYNMEESEAIEGNITSTITSVVDNIVDETINPSILSINKKNKISNESSSLSDTLNVAEQRFDVDKSISSMSNIMISTVDYNCFNNKEESEAMEVDVASTNTSVLNNISDEMMSTSILSANNKNKISNESSSVSDTLNVVEQIYDVDKSISSISNIMVPMININSYNKEEESEAMEVDIKSSNTSIVDNIFDETISTSMISCNGKNKSFDKSSNEINQTEYISDITEQSFNVKKSLDNIVVSSLNSNDTLLFSEFKDNTLKHSPNIEIPCTEKINSVFTKNISETNENTTEDNSRGMRQYLEFEQTIYNMCNDVSSENCNTNLNNSNIYDNQTLENISIIEETLCSDSFISIKDDDNSVRPKLSVIIENRTLEENCNDTEQNEHFENPISDVMTTSFLKNNMNEFQENVKLSESINQNEMESITSEDVSKSDLNKTDNKFDIKNKSNEDISYHCDITLNENLDKTDHDINSTLSGELSKIETGIESYLNNKFAEEHFPVSKDVKEICLNKSNLEQIHIQENILNNPDFTATECSQESISINKTSNYEQSKFLNDIQNLNVLNTDKSMLENSLEEYNKLEQMCNLEENKKLQTYDYKTPRVQKLLDFSILQQTPSFVNQVQKQKLLNFSIVDQTPNRKSTQSTDLEENTIGKKDTLIDLSAFDQMWDLDVMLPNEMHLKNSSRNSSLKNLSAISVPDLELLADESIITNSSNHNDSSLNQTITDTNLNLSTSPKKINDFKEYIDKKDTKETDVESTDKDYCPMLLNNEKIKTDESYNSLKTDKTVEKINFEFTYATESKQNKSCNNPCENDSTTETNYQSTCSSNTTLNQSFKKLNPTEFIMNPDQKSTLNPNLCAIKDFSIVEEQILKIPESKENINSMSVGSDLNASNLIEMSVVSNTDLKLNDQALVSSDNPITVVNSDKKSINNSSDEINNTAIHIEEHIFSHNPEFLTDIQMSDISLVESSEKSSVIESFHSIESDQLQEDNKRKSEPDQVHNSQEKKLKVATEEPSTPMSMLYKLRNIFKSSEKPSFSRSNTKENDLKSDKCHQKLNFNNFEENKDKSICYKKPEVSIKSKIPCKISDKSMLKNCEFNTSSSSLNDSIKPKKAIPRFIGAPVLSDVSNSSNRKCPESRIPSKFKN